MGAGMGSRNGDGIAIPGPSVREADTKTYGQYSLIYLCIEYTNVQINKDSLPFLDYMTSISFPINHYLEIYTFIGTLAQTCDQSNALTKNEFSKE